jgi:predicted O-methyltransferase YrrM
MLTKSLDFSKKVTRVINQRVQSFSIQRTLGRRGLINAHKIQTFTVREELEELFQLAHRCPPNARVLEVGSYLGASTCYLAAGLRGTGASITCIDTWQNQTMPDGIRDTLAEFESNLKSVRQQINLIHKASSDVTLAELEKPFDLIFLDGDHSYRQTKADFDNFSRLVAKEGTLVFHDSMFFEGVSRVIGEALASAEWQIGGHVQNLFWIKAANFAHKS